MATPTAKMLLGIQPTCWTNDDFPEIGNNTAYQDILNQTKQAGFQGGSTGHNYPTHLPSLLKAMGNLRIASTWAGTTFTTGVDIDGAFNAFKTQVAFLKAVGSKDVVVAELANAVNQVRTKSVLTERPILSGPQWFLLTQLLDRAGEYAHKQKMQLSYHPHVGTGVQTVEETVQLLDSTNPDYVGLCLDTAHLYYGGASQAEIVQLTKTYVNRIKHVHLKNVRESVRRLAVRNKYSFYQAIKTRHLYCPGRPRGKIEIGSDSANPEECWVQWLDGR